jgi:transposase
MEALWLKSQDLPHKEICRLTGISKGTLCAYLRAYQQGGIEKLKELNFYRPVSELAAHTSTLEEYFRHHPPASLKQAMAKIEQLTGIKVSSNKYYPPKKQHLIVSYCPDYPFLRAKP